MPTTYPDIQVTEGDQTFEYSKEGPKCRRTFILDNCDMSIPTSTLWNVVFNVAQEYPDEMQLPMRGAPHPSIFFPNNWNTTNAFCADVIQCKAITSTQARVTVDYQMMNGLTQEANADNDSALALLIISSSVQTIETSTDIAGNVMVVPYCSGGTGAGGGTNSYNITTQANVNGVLQAVNISPSATSLGPPFRPGQPNTRVTASIQVPTVLLRFQRRETQPRNNQYVGYVNSSYWDLSDPWPSIGVINAQCALCTRIENTTLDESQSYCVTYEFQVGQLAYPPQPYGGSGTATSAEYVPPASSVLATVGPYIGTSCMSPWQALAWYTINNGSGAPNESAPEGSTYLSGGQIPPDANPFVFQMYQTCDFSSVLNLPGTQAT